MKTSMKTRAVAFVTAILATFTTVYLISEYAYPEAAVLRLASTAR